ncbi:NUDIX domain-containing protein [Streptomyces sp. NPDC097617]|uniref:NUDIX domain-containing protein n=1 Tax=Streptomyces sp. NPDC097617 TaxID=3366091 RepID=UPI00380C0B58
MPIAAVPSLAPGHPMTAGVLITDPTDRLLIVHSASGGPWHLPGGIVEQGESPLDAARREAREELGIAIDIREYDLFAVEWLQATRPGRRDRVVFLFAGPVLDADSPFSLQPDELDMWRWAARGELDGLLHPTVARRIVGPLQTPGAATYLETRTQRTL